MYGSEFVVDGINWVERQNVLHFSLFSCMISEPVSVILPSVYAEGAGAWSQKSQQR